MSNSSSTASASSEAPARPPRRGLFGIARNLALASIGIAGVLAMKPEPCIGAASSAWDRSSACVHGSHIPTGRTADPSGPWASVGGIQNPPVRSWKRSWPI